MVLTSCQDKKIRTYQANVPTMQSLQEWRQTEFSLEEPRALERPGKIYVYGTFLFVNEYLEGVHFFDNANPSAPVNLGFLPVLANVDIAVKDNKMYLDSYFDLLTFDISDIMNPVLDDRELDIFEFHDYGYLTSFDPNFPMAQADYSSGVVTGWTIGETTEDVNDNFHYDVWALQSNFFSADASTGASGASFLSGTGKAGSTARFAIYEDNLYALHSWQMSVFSIGASTDFIRNVAVQWNAETLFPAQGNMFIGTQNGMLVYSLTDPSNPQFLSEYWHWTSCDPVVVDGDRAYVTLSTGRTCQGDLNVLQVLDISNISNPFLIRQYNMTNPKGLGVDGELLFLCDGSAGLKVYDRTNDTQIDVNRLATFANINTNDVIPMDGILLMTSEEEIYQYDYTDPLNISQLSLIPAN